MKTQKFIVIRLCFPTRNLFCLGSASNKGFASIACSHDFNRLFPGFFFCLFSLIPSESRTGIIIMLAVVVVESSTSTCQRGCLGRGASSLFIAQSLKATSGLHFLTVLDRQKEVPLAVEKVCWQCSQGRQDKLTLHNS